MYCTECGNTIDTASNFCAECGTLFAAMSGQMSLSPPVKKSKRNTLILMIAAILVVTTIGAGVFVFLWLNGDRVGNINRQAVDYWIGSEPLSDFVIETALWRLDATAIVGTNIGSGDRLLSISPSGRYFLVVDAAPEINIHERRPGNPLGRFATHISLYAYENGRLTRVNRIDFAPDYDLLWNDTLVESDDMSVAWCPNENRILMARGMETKRMPSVFWHTNADIFLVDFTHGTIENLTICGNGLENIQEGAYIDFLPQWIDDENIRFIRYADDGHYFTANLMNMDLVTGSVTRLADLSVAEGRWSLVLYYTVHDESVYFSRHDMGDFNADILSFDVSGFFTARLDSGRTEPALLVSLTDMHINVEGRILQELMRVEVSSCGRWALLTALERRFAQRDIPLADGYLSQPDPRLAISQVTRLAWEPLHHVVLYDLQYNRIVNPFSSEMLRPYVVIVTGATFSPDGKTLICAVFGSGDAWTMDSFNETTLYQVRLDDGSFDAVRIFRTDLLEGHYMIVPLISWLDNDTLWIHNAWFWNRRFYETMLFTPAAFERFVN